MTPVGLQDNPDLDILQENDPQDPGENTEGEDTSTEKKVDPKEEPEDDIDDILRELVEAAEEEDRDLRYKLISFWKRNEYYFNNIQNIVWDDVAKDFKDINGVLGELDRLSSSTDIKMVNIYRAFAESLIAALSVALPSIAFPPDDAENPEDIDTSEAYTRASELIQKHTQAPLQLIKALTIFFNQGLVAGFTYYKEDPAYGTIRTAKSTKPKQLKLIDLRCPNCSNLLESSLPESTQASQSKMTCPQCNTTAAPASYLRLDNVDEVSEWEETPKGMVGFDIFGPTYVKLPLYAKNPAGVGYAILRLEDHIAKWKTTYSDFADDITGSGDTELYERWGRIPVEYQGSVPQHIVTARFGYFRPWYYNQLEKEKAEKLFAQYPDGVMVTLIGDVVVDKASEKFDDRWEITFDPRSNFIHSEPAGNAMVPIQDAKTDIFNLGLMSIEYGIPENFVNPRTLNLGVYKNTAKTPGMMTAAMPPSPDKSLGDGFFSTKTATLSNEYIEFDKSLDGLGQFVMGAFPSIFGGAMSGGGGTATEYTESRSRALQRLQLTWQMISYFWVGLMSKCTRQFIDNMREDTKFAKQENGTYINVWIKKSQLHGSIGHIEPELNSQLPQSWAQKKDFLMQLLGMGIPQLAPIFLHPCNTEILKQATGMPEFYLPGETDRNKQYAEYYELAAVPADQGTSQPTVPIDIDVDDHQIHMLVLKNILTSMMGIQLYKTQPANYQNCINHYRAHEMAVQAKSQEPAEGSPAGQPAPTAAVTK